MGYVTDFIIGSTIGLVLYVLIISSSQSITSTLEFSDKIQKEFIIKFLSAICLLCLAFTSLSRGGKLQNNAVKWGLMLSGAALSMNTMIINWDKLSNGTRIILIGSCLSVIIWYAYYLESGRNLDNTDDDDGEEDNDIDGYEQYIRDKRRKTTRLDDEFEYDNYENNIRTTEYLKNVNQNKTAYREVDMRSIPQIDPHILMRY